MQETVKNLQAQVKKAKSAIAERNKDIQRKNNKKEEMLAKNNDIQLKIKEHSHELKKLEDSYKNAQLRVICYLIYKETILDFNWCFFRSKKSVKK